MVTLNQLHQLWRDKFRAVVITGWRWWVGELSALVPAHVRELFQEQSAAVTVDIVGRDIVVQRTAGGATLPILRVSRDELESPIARQAAIENVLKATDPADHVVMRLPGGDLLRKTVKLPFAARRNLKNILKYELERVSPLDPGKVYFDHRVLHHDKATNTLEIELRILKRESADDAVQFCRSIGLEPSVIGFVGEAGGEQERSFPVSRAATLRGRWSQWRVASLAALVVVLGLSELLAAYAREQAAEEALAGQLARARANAQVAERLQNDLAKAKQGIAFLDSQKQSPLVVKVLAEVTRILPDHTWLIEFELQGREVRINGYSRAASSLIALFDSSKLFTNAQFRAPLTQGPANDLERFDLSFEIRSAAT